MFVLIYILYPGLSIYTYNSIEFYRAEKMARNGGTYIW